MKVVIRLDLSQNGVLDAMLTAAERLAIVLVGVEIGILIG